MVGRYVRRLGARDRSEPAPAQPRESERVVPPTDDVDASLDALRRRLYRADATPEDVQRYRDRLDSVRPPLPTAPPPARPRGRAAPLLALLLVPSAVAALVVGAQASRPEVLDPVVAAPAPLPARSHDEFDDEMIATGRTLAGPRDVAVTIAGTAVAGQRYRGTGGAVLPLAAPRGAFDGGRMLVDLTTSGPDRVGWRARAVDLAEPSSSVLIASGAVRSPVGADPPMLLRYPAQPPTRLEIDAPAGVGWSVLIAFADSTSPVLH
jgi:hypothetical protein